MDKSRYELFETWICNNCRVEKDIDILYNCFLCGKIECNICINSNLIDINNYFICSNCHLV